MISRRSHCVSDLSGLGGPQRAGSGEISVGIDFLVWSSGGRIMIVSGSVKFFNEERGYGFMLPDQPLGDTFFHIAALRKMGIPNVLPGQRAVFEVSIAPGRGLRVERFFLVHSGSPEQCALESELMKSLTVVRADIDLTHTLHETMQAPETAQVAA